MTITLAELQADMEAGTPGPWSAHNNAVQPTASDDGARYWTVYSGSILKCPDARYCSGYIALPDGGSSVADVQFGPTEANARRIARLPDTEAALIEAVGVLREAQSLFSLLVDPAQFEGVSSGDAYLKIRQAEAKARALLAKLGADK